MDDVLIQRWNAKVGPDDVVYVLGDFSFRSADETAMILRRLNGRKRLVVGNHDDVDIQQLIEWDDVGDYAEVIVDGQRAVLSHYPLDQWNASGHGAVQFHGHTHGSMDPRRNRIDVGVDIWNYEPVNMATLLREMAKWPEWPIVHERWYRRAPYRTDKIVEWG